MHDGQFPVGFLELILARILVDAKDLVIVLSLAFLELELCVADVFGNARFLWVSLLDGFQVADGGFPVTAFAESGSFCFAGFEVGGVQGEGTIAVINGRFVVFQLESQECQRDIRPTGFITLGKDVSVTYPY